MNIEKRYESALSDLAAEREEKQKLRTELENLRLYFSELEATNNHLVSATWRERDLKKKLADTLEELNKTKNLVESQNKRITESINYARKIQLAINPTEEDLKKHYNESFILYQPKDVISGDFPWIFEYGKHVYVAAVDCTGHGVPGAMLSMIGNLLLNDIVNDGELLLPSEILSKLHKLVVQTLKQEENNANSNDGMDIGLCRINRESNEIVFSGAHRPLFLLRDSVVEVFSGDKFPIGGLHYKGKNTYTDHKISFRKGDSIDVFTDGFPDQIGGEEKKKLMTRNLKALIEANHALSMGELKNNLSDFFNQWKGGNKQIDDILLIGLQF
jgi:serine phosphatase RsbU (regulator of sigma subunit)